MKVFPGCCVPLPTPTDNCALYGYIDGVLSCIMCTEDFVLIKSDKPYMCRGLIAKDKEELNCYAYDVGSANGAG